jgi:diguanylate cyclase
LEAKASAIQINCKDDPEKIQFEKASSALLDFSKDLRGKIESDFKYISGTFLSLLKHVKELERSFAGEFGGEKQVKEVEYFEMKINEDVSSILRSFDVYSTIGEIKSAVLNKIENIKRAVSLRKRKEKERAQLAKENMKKLRERIIVAEKEAHEMSRTAEQHKMAAMKDGLTELYNRKALDVRLEGAFETFRETNNPFSLILFDVDKFKNINDNFGHVAGDTVLKKVAQCLKETFREDDFISRYGGDEFVVIIEKLTEKMALEKISKFTENLGKKRFVSHKKGEINITVSAGFSFVQEGDTPKKLLEKADKNMYTAKSRQKKQK